MGRNKNTKVAEAAAETVTETISTETISTETAVEALSDSLGAEVTADTDVGIPVALWGISFATVMGKQAGRVVQPVALFEGLDSTDAVKGFLLSEPIVVNGASIRVGVPRKLCFSQKAADQYLNAVGIGSAGVAGASSGGAATGESSASRKQVALDRRAIEVILARNSSLNRSEACKLLGIAVDPGPAPAKKTKAATSVAPAPAVTVEAVTAAVEATSSASADDGQASN